VQWEGRPNSLGTPKNRRVACNFSRVPFLGGRLYEGGDTCSICRECETDEIDSYGLCRIYPSDVAAEFDFFDN
jgi:hypothetical protein